MRGHLATLARGSNRELTERLVIELISKFGGIRPLVSQWVALVDSEEVTSSVKARSLAAILQLQMHVEATRPSPSSMTDADFAVEMAKHVEQFVKAHPEVAIESLQQAGFTVSRPEFNNSRAFSN